MIDFGDSLIEGTKEKIHDSVEVLIFQNRDQIVEWSKNQLPFSIAYSKDILIKGCNIYIVMVSGCSGLPCWNIYIFKEKGTRKYGSAYLRAARKRQNLTNNRVETGAGR